MRRAGRAGARTERPAHAGGGACSWTFARAGSTLSLRRMPPEPKKTVARSLGEFVGFIWRGIRADVSREPTHRREVRRCVEEEPREVPGGKVILRRTTIEEVEYPPEPVREEPRESPGERGS